MGKRADVVVLLADAVFVFEFKVGSTSYDQAAQDQVLDYALDLKNFHAGSHEARILPVLVATQAVNQPQVFLPFNDGLYQPLLLMPTRLVNACVWAALLLPAHRLAPPRGWPLATNLLPQLSRPPRHFTKAIKWPTLRVLMLVPPIYW